MRNKTLLCTVTKLEMRECEHHMFSATKYIISLSNKSSNDDTLFAFVAIVKGFK